MYCDILIKDGFIIDGTGKPGYYSDLAIKDGKITGIAKINCEAGRVIDAARLTICPGFIDPHVHAELRVLTNSKFEELLRQGVTTAINGNCGHSVTPYSSDNIFEYMAAKGLISLKAKEKYKRTVPPWNNFSEYIDILKNKGSNINMGFLLGYGTLRWSIIGDSKNRKPSLDEQQKLNHLIEEGMEQGALGISTGLAYTPSKYADTDEIIAVSKVAKKYDGIYASHLRSYIGILEAVREAIKIGTKADLRVQVSHLTPNSPEAFEEIITARKMGLEIAADTIPKSSGHFKRKEKLLQFLALASSKPFESGINGLLEAMRTPQGRRKIAKRIRFKDELIIINADDLKMENQTLKKIALDKNVDVDELLLDLLENENYKLTFCQGGLNRWDFPGTPYLYNIADNPYVMVGSDIIYGDDDDPFDWYELFRKGSFPIFFALTRQKGIRLEEIIRRVTALPAQQFRLSDRGILAAGKAADITIIDIDNFNYPSNQEINIKNPLTMANGVKYMIVNGRIVMDDGQLKETKAGQILSINGRQL